MPRGGKGPPDETPLWGLLRRRRTSEDAWGVSDAGRCRGGVFTLDGSGGHGSGGKSRVIRSGKGKGREEGLFIFVYF